MAKAWKNKEDDNKDGQRAKGKVTAQGDSEDEVEEKERRRLELEKLMTKKTSYTHMARTRLAWTKNAKFEVRMKLLTDFGMTPGAQQSNL